MKANPEDFGLLNNLTFSLASAGAVQEARGEYDKIESEDLTAEEEVTWLATGGLLAFREGKFAEGRTLYRTAIEKARAASLGFHGAMAAAFLAREALLAGGEGAAWALEFATKEVKRVEDAEALIAVLEHVRRLLPVTPAR